MVLMKVISGVVVLIAHSKHNGFTDERKFGKKIMALSIPSNRRSKYL